MRIHEKNLIQLWAKANSRKIMWANVAMYLFGALAVLKPQTDDEILQHDQLGLLYSIASQHADKQVSSIMQSTIAHVRDQGRRILQ